ncbi:MAG: hypothetical protein K2J30_06375 [Clostridia bacterium]|nr:hypothetical protein [Clostridia bacterium]
MTHAVETPLIPDVRSARCFYSYDFTAGQAWAAFRSLEVEIYAESAPKSSTLNFAEGEGVFTHERSNLPMNALRFSLGEYEESSWTNNADDWQVALIILAVLAVVAAGVVVIVVTVRRKRLKMLEMRAKNNIEESDREEKK